ncbi:MAG: 3-dehydroquinate synthase [Verrucomicrobia bacterium]|nr:3-dehydroquinate synthase [Verrucomicrobiota bacterium]
MSVVERVISVQYHLRLQFTDGVFAPGNPLLASELLRGDADVRAGRGKVLLVIEEALVAARPGLVPQIEAYFAARADRLHLVCPPVRVAGGEAVKNDWARVVEILERVHRHHIDRHSHVVAVGGGALLDMVGLAAATAHRGVRLIRIPTTTLAQDDSGVGVKNGVNAFGKKNFVGTFVPPTAVINDFDLLASLPDRDKRAGYVEAVKVACIRDHAFFERLERDAPALAAFEPEAMRHLIRRSAELHLDHIALGGDPFEMGSARPLDFGHWAAHKLEQMTGYRLRHGEAVAIGIALDVFYSVRKALLDRAWAERILGLLERLGFTLFDPELRAVGPSGALAVLEGLEEFREHLGGELTITLLESIGRGVEVHEMDLPEVRQALDDLEARHRARAIA